MNLRSLLMIQLFLDLLVPVLHIVVACTRFDVDSTSFAVLLTVLLVVITWSLTNGISWVILLRHRGNESGLDWIGLGCHLIQLGPLWRFTKALSGSPSSQFTNLVLLHLIPVFLQDLPLSVFDVYLMLTAKKEFVLLLISAIASIMSASLILTSYREEVIRLTRKTSSDDDSNEISQDADPSKIVDFPALGILRQEAEKQSAPNHPVVFTVVRGDCKLDALNLQTSSGDQTSEEYIMEMDHKVTLSSDMKTEQVQDIQENKSSVRHWTRFIWMTSLLVSRVVSIASFAAVKPWMIFLLLPAHWLIALVGLRVQAHYAKRRSRRLECKDRLQDFATSYAYIFCFLNLKPGHALVMSSFYHTVILTESVGLVAVFLWNFEGEEVYMIAVTTVAFSSFFVAIFLVVVFYCVFSERVYLLIVEKCTCCIWWNSERKRRAEEKVARKAAKLEAKKVMTQSGTQINVMATHIMTTLSLLPNSPNNHGNTSSSVETPNSQEFTDANTRELVRDLTVQENGVIRSSAIATMTQDESGQNGVSFTVDAFSENPTFRLDDNDDNNTTASNGAPRSSPSADQIPQSTDGEADHQVNGLKQLGKANGTVQPKTVPQITPNASLGRKQKGPITNQGIISKISAEVHDEQRPHVKDIPSVRRNSCSKLDADSTQARIIPTVIDSVTLNVYEGLQKSPESLVESSVDSDKLEEKFDEILLDENLDICVFWP